MSDTENRHTDNRELVAYYASSRTLYDVLMYWAHSGRPCPEWLVGELELGFKSSFEGKRTLESVFGLERRKPAQADKEARRLNFSPAIYHRVVDLASGGKAIDTALFEELAEEFKQNFLQDQPGKKPPSGRTLKEWYLKELGLRSPETKAARNRRKSKTD